VKAKGDMDSNLKFEENSLAGGGHELPKSPVWKIGNVEIPNRFVLAPMAGVTDLAFRRLCKEQGAGLLCMEMISAKAISYKNKNTRELMKIDPVEHPISLQLFGSEPLLMAEVAKEIEESLLISWISIWDARCRRW